MSKTRDIKLRAFEIANPSAKKANSDLLEKLHSKLESSLSVNDRRMSLNHTNDSNNEQDIITYFDKKCQPQNPLFCTLIRVALGNNVQHISSNLFSKETFTVQDLEETILSSDAVYKRHFHFIVSKNHLVTTMPGNITIKGLQTYLNWYLDELYEVNPKIQESKLSSLSEIDSIEVRDPITKDESTDVSQSTSSSSREFTKTLKNLSRSFLEKFMKDAPDLKQEELDQMISARLVLQFRKPRENDPEALKRAYSALLKPVSDVDHYKIKRRHGSPICSGQDILEIKTVSVELLDSDVLNEQELEQEMKKYILELEKNA